MSQRKHPAQTALRDARPGEGNSYSLLHFLSEFVLQSLFQEHHNPNLSEDSGSHVLCSTGTVASASTLMSK